MAGATIGSGAEGRRRSLDTEVNLVPFIDLLSMCICFLLMTAVWTQLGSVEVKQATGTEAAEPAKDALDLEAKFLRAEQLQITLKKGARAVKTFAVSAAEGVTLAQALAAQLAPLKAQVGSVRITPKEGVDYGSLVAVMDAFRQNQLSNIGVVPVAPHGGK